MNQDDIRKVVKEALAKVAPEADFEHLRTDVNLREQIDMDSMDFLNFIIAIHEALQVEIPEADYGQLTTLDDCYRYLAPHASQSHERHLGGGQRVQP